MSIYPVDNYFQGYTYSYPHKSAYRHLAQAIPLNELWAQEKKENLFLYLHIPFCEMRCGFCNLFTMANPSAEYESPYILALERQAVQIKAALGDMSFARMAIGGGTPTFMNIKDLEKMFSIVFDIMGVDRSLGIPNSVEMSPKTATPEKLALLAEMGATRASIGVQSFILEETKALGRPQKLAEVRQALDWIKDSGIPEMNIDLIYGPEGQSFDSWQYSIEQAMDYAPEEIFLYPLYVRPLTGLGMKDKEWNDYRLSLYRFGRDFLLKNGYEQVTMRCFRRIALKEIKGPPYHLTENGMIGLGVGARSYTKAFHYSTEYAVTRGEVKQIIHDYNGWTDKQFSELAYGCALNLEEQKRRYAMKSLLEGGGLNLEGYQNYFGTDAMDDLPQLFALCQDELANLSGHRLQLNQAGLELSDVIGPWLYSDAVNAMMQEFDLV
jgi:oxygen-independent coproporphyrinogen-3 oxidase